MSVSPGCLFTRDDTGQALFLGPAEVTALQEAAQEILAEPSAAGQTPDAGALKELVRLLGATAPGEEPVRMPGEAAAWIELIHGQSLIREALREQGRLRVRHRCRVCDRTLLVDPDRESRTNEEQSDAAQAKQTSGLAKSAAGFDVEHPYRSIALLLLQLVEDEAGKQDVKDKALSRVCAACDSADFETAGLTAFCPGCRAPRTETVLLTCPECGHDFRGAAAAAPVWRSPAEARRARAVALLAARAGEFEKGLRDTQRDALAGTLTGEEELVAMCRCALPGEFGRYVALLFTTTHLAWARESMMSATTSGLVRWADVTAVEDPAESAAEYESGLRLTVAQGAPLVLNDFRGKGVCFGDREAAFDGEGVRRLARLLRGEPPAPAAGEG
ncbi:hypothetical protein MF672_046775 [Actinomadura sp. ATCC 31491]|uniref:Uncharacterized protein n=1 Tax=Actinomadura luzonensis TaxID=2805427 RepID=A0ABT0G9I5_9ACTN|nr:hypothetical protein [Actinomadura luzonensis]MCK2221259.1 hypothetical protein [Actinomadura luzonensis]